ncbi:MAG: AI-2E family transporter [Armatimonadota bacterium]
MERNWLRLALWAAGIVVAIWVLGRFSTLIAIAVAVLLFTFPIYPVVDWLEQRWHLPRGAAAALTMLGLLVAVVVGLLLVIPWIMGQTQVLLDLGPSGIAAVADFFTRWQARVNEPTFPQLLRTAWERAGESAVAAANSALAGTVNFAVRLFGQIYLVLLVPFIVYFVLLDYRTARESGLALISEPMRTRLADLLDKLTTTLRWGLWAQVVVSSIVGALTAIGLWLVGVPGAFAIGVFGGVAEAIPYVGGFATYGVALLAAAPKGGSVWAWAMVVVTVVKLLSNILVPLVLGRMTRTHPLAIIASLLVLGQLFGLLGMFFAVPAVVVVKEVLSWWRSSQPAG